MACVGDMIDVFCSEEGDLIVNAGECLQMITGDLIRAAPHLVQFPTAATETSCDNGSQILINMN